MWRVVLPQDEHAFVGQSEASREGRNGDVATSTRSSERETSWWTLPGSNRSPPRCKRGALPNELRAHNFFRGPQKCGAQSCIRTSTRFWGKARLRATGGADSVATGYAQL